MVVADTQGSTAMRSSVLPYGTSVTLTLEPHAPTPEQSIGDAGGGAALLFSSTQDGKGLAMPWMIPGGADSL